MNRRAFLATVGAVAAVATLPTPAYIPGLRVERDVNGTWINVPEGLRVMRPGDHFRTLLSDGSLWVEGIATGYGLMTPNDDGVMVGAVPCDYLQRHSCLVEEDNANETRS